MIIDGSSLAGVLDANKGQNVENTKVSDPTKENELAKTGQTTDAGPAVVTSFSAAALESARAVPESSQVADQDRIGEQQNKPKSSYAGEQQERIDVMA